MIIIDGDGRPKRAYENIPLFLREIGCCFGNYREKKDSLNSYAVIRGELGMLMPNDPGTWAMFEDAIKAYRNTSWKNVHGVSYVVQRVHNMIVIDLDPPKPRNKVPHFTDEQYARYIETTQQFNQKVIQFFTGVAWIEWSSSGAGVHIFIEGTVPDFSGLPASDRYEFLGGGSMFIHGQCINLTGNMHPASGFMIGTDQQRVNNFVQGMMQTGSISGTQAREKNIDRSDFYDQSLETFGRRTDLTDEQVLEQYFGKNRAQHPEIYNGTRDQINSLVIDKSNGDHLLIGELDKISAWPDQILRIVMRSPRMADEKRSKKMLRIFDSELDKQRVSNNEHLATLARNDPTVQSNVLAILTGPGSLAYKKEETVRHVAAQFAEHGAAASPVATKGDYDETPAFVAAWPPGLMGGLAKEHYAMSHYPNQTMSVAWAFAAVAGLAQRSYHIGGLGVSLYIMLLAETGSGKEGLGKTMTQLYAQLQETFNDGKLHMLFNLMGPSIYASGPSIYKNISSKPRQISILNEASFFFEGMGDAADRIGKEKKAALLDIRTKADRYSLINGYVHSDPDKSVKPVHVPSQTLLAEGQPDRFYRAINTTAAEDGLLSRFLIFDAYRNYRGHRNIKRQTSFSAYLLNRVYPLALHAMELGHATDVPPLMADVKVTPDADELFSLFEEKVITKLSVAADKIRHNLFNRSIATGRVLAALLAIVENPALPIVDNKQARYALDLIYGERSFLHNKFVTNSVGGDHQNRAAKLLDVLKSYQKTEDRMITDEMKVNGIVPRKFIRKRLERSPLFADGFVSGKTSDQVIDATIFAAIKDGVLRDVTDAKDIDFLGKGVGQWFAIRDLSG